MKQLVPAEIVEVTGEVYPVSGQRCSEYSVVLAMELFGCSVAQVVQETGLSEEEVNEICSSQDYQYIKQSMINNIRKLDRQTLSGRIAMEASEAFDRMTELSRDAKKEDVRLEANKDILDRAMLTGLQNSKTDELRITFVKRR